MLQARFAALRTGILPNGACAHKET